MSDAYDAMKQRAEQAEADVKRYREALAEIYGVAKNWQWDMPEAEKSQALGFALGRCQGIAEKTLTDETAKPHFMKRDSNEQRT